MQTKSLFSMSVLALTAFTLFLSCAKEEGCTDNTATNFNANAMVDDGSCTYSTEGYLKTTFELKANQASPQLKQFATLADGRILFLETFKFYASNLRPGNATSGITEPIMLFDFKVPDPNASIAQFDNVHVYKANIGNYTNINFGLGVIDTINKVDPTTYPNDHPLSAFQNMQWTWVTMHIFAKVEGRWDKNANGVVDVDDPSFFIHSGLDTFYRNITVNQDFTISPNDTTLVTIQLSLDSLFAAIPLDSLQSHTTNDLPMTARMVENFTRSFK